MRRFLHGGPALVCIITLAATSAFADRTEWSQWRGPGHDGIYPEETDWSATWGKEGPRHAWKAVVGTGYSTVAVSEGRVYSVGHPDGPDDVVYCLDDQTGNPVWTQRYPQDLVATYNSGGPNATPVVDGKWVYVFSKQGLLTCFDKARGEVRWRRDLVKDEGAKVPMWGFASTPLIVGDRIYLNANESGIALNKDSGALIWKSKPDASGYSSIVALRHHDEDCLAVLGTRELFVVRQSDGKQLWRTSWATKMGENSADPLAVADMVYVSSWWEMGAALFDLSGPADKPVWTNKEFQNHIAAPVLFEGHLYGFDGPVHRRSQKIALRCVDFKTGQIKWSEPGMVGSLVVADKKLIVLTNDGDLIIAEASPAGYKEINRAKVAGVKSWAPPALHRGRLYIRDAEHVYCFDLRKEQSAAPVPPTPDTKKATVAIVLQSPLDYEVFQRHIRDEGNVVLRGKVQPARGTLHVRWTGKSAHGELPQGWQAIRCDATTGGFDHTVAIPAGGWYRLDLRLTDGGATVAESVIERVGVGEVFVVAGQSNSTNYGSQTQRPKSGMVASFDGQKWALAADPQPGVQDGSKGGSFIPAFGDALVEKYQVPVGVASTGQGATSVRQWLPKGHRMDKQPTISSFIKTVEVDGKTQWESTGQLFEGLMTRVEKLGPKGCRAILWHQGESDAGQARGGYPADRQITGDEYRRYMTTLIEASQKRAEWKLPWFVAQATYHSETDPADDEFRAAQKAMWESGLALQGPDTDALRAEYRDGVHFNAKGLDAHGKLWAEKVAAHLDKALKAKPAK